jgi:hypothetical protein
MLMLQLELDFAFEVEPLDSASSMEVVIFLAFAGMAFLAATFSFVAFDLN